MTVRQSTTGRPGALDAYLEHAVDRGARLTEGMLYDRTADTVTGRRTNASWICRPPGSDVLARSSSLSRPNRVGPDSTRSHTGQLVIL